MVQAEQAERAEQPGPTEQIENVVLGGGEAGRYVAWLLAQRGRREMVAGMVDIHSRRFAAPNIEFLLTDVPARGAA